jgi:capsular exopolysaccharide synthesis family protein
LQRASVFARAYVAYRTRASVIKQSPGKKTTTPATEPVASIMTEPVLPKAPQRPNYPLIVALSLIVGAMLGAACAFIWDRLSGRLRSDSEVEAQTGLPVLASVPALKRVVPTTIAVLAQPRVRGAETYGYLTARVVPLVEQHGASSLLVTSPSPGAGKTTVAVNLAASLAASGRQTVLMSADQGNATMHRYFGFDPEPGLTDVLRGTLPLARAVHSTSLPALHVLTRGSAVGSGEAVMNLEDIALVIRRLSSSHGFVIVDAPTLLGTTEAALIADKVDLVLMVVDVRSGARADAAAAADILEHVGSTFIGSVANDPGRRRRRQQHPQEPYGSGHPLGGATNSAERHLSPERAPGPAGS